MTRRLPVEPAPGPLEDYATRLDALCVEGIVFGRESHQPPRHLQGVMRPLRVAKQVHQVYGPSSLSTVRLETFTHLLPPARVFILKS